MELGQRLKQARLEAGLSQRQLCGDQLTRNMLSQIENGSARPSMDTLAYLSARLGKPISFFLEEDPASPNQSRMTAARAAYTRGEYAAALDALAEYAAPDPIFDAECDLLQALCCMALSEAAPNADLLARAAQSGRRSPYYTPELERRRLLLLAQASAEDPAAIAQALPADDRELLLRARAALSGGDPARCAALLDAAEDQTAADWLILRADAAMAAGDPARAAEWYQKAEPAAPQQVYAKLEQCFLRLEDYKMAYYYACKQR